ncbi:MAG TPA: DUF1501 domain-containing protein [Verrucomicrobiales bacterium]|nr:DUF1501 domain-containing protein [Verrucomicrobiales bacterium]HIL71595.1 DUF1501 domain-containing protein [Verrucomicrobiota bacterium]
MLKRTSSGFGSLALSAMLADSARASLIGSANPSVSTPSPFKARAKNVIFLFMEGAVSQVDSFDYKPMLEKYHGTDPRKTIGKLEKTQFENIGKVLKSPWNFQQHGQRGLWASDLFPYVNQVMDELCLVRSMTSKFPEHTSANYFLHSGSGLQGRPSMGAWVTYGLGSCNQNLPAYVVLNGGQIPSGGLDNFSSGFLPARFQGSLLHAAGETPLANILPLEKVKAVQGIKRKLVRRLNQAHSDLSGNADALESAIANYELAARMQVAVPDLMDLSKETESIKNMYGLESDYVHTRTYARECLIARRLVERGVRFIELTIPMVEGYQRWDAHGNLRQNHGNNARAVDQPIAGLIRDLRQRGLLDDTLVLWAGEFGRTPFAQGKDGRDHNEYGYSIWMAGGGIQGGLAYGATDEWGYKAIENPLEMHDLHATILHLLGVDHEGLTYRFGGRDIRLTDVHGRVVHEILS